MTTRGPLSGLVVLDLSRVLAGPYATMVLADMGARVIKVETPAGGDDARHFGPFINKKSAYFMSLNRGKESIALNLKNDDDRKIFEQLLQQADILVENYRPGTMEKLGYGWDHLKTINERLIYAAVSGFGHTGPYRQRAAYDMVVQGMGGIMSVTGYEGQEPTRVGTSIGDISAGMFGVAGILSALYERQQSGLGMMVDVSMLDCQVAMLENAIARYTADHEIPGPLGARHPSITPFAAFKAQNGYIIIAAGNDVLFEKLCNAIKRPELHQDQRFINNVARTKHSDALTAELNTTLETLSVERWLAILETAGVPSGPINNIEQVLNDPQVSARNMVISTDDPVSGNVTMAGNPIKLSRFSDPLTRPPAPDLDADREQILSTLLGSALGSAQS